MTSPTPGQPSLEYTLATIDAGYKVTEDNIQVKRFRYLLKVLSERTGETQYDIADYIARATNVARDEYGKEFKILDIMERVHAFYKSTDSKVKYNHVVAAIILDEAK